MSCTLGPSQGVYINHLIILTLSRIMPRPPRSVVSLWRCGERVGQLGEIHTDQPWCLAAVDYDDPAQGMLFERASHFLLRVIEQLPDVDDPAEDDRAYFAAMHACGLEEHIVKGFLHGPWELRWGSRRQRIDLHLLEAGLLQWRGPWLGDAGTG